MGYRDIPIIGGGSVDLTNTTGTLSSSNVTAVNLATSGNGGITGTLSIPSGGTGANAARVAYYDTSSTNVTSTTAIINFTNKIYDYWGTIATTGASWSATAPFTGKYQIDIGIRYASNTIGVGGIQEAFIYVNGGNQVSIARQLFSGLTGIIQLNSTYKVNLNVNDTFQVRATNNTTTALDGTNNNFISIQYLGT